MPRKDAYEEFDPEIKPDQTHAQIIIEILPSSKTVREAQEFIEKQGVHIIETKPLSRNRVIFKLNIKDMREIVLMLTENGFVNISGINALRVIP
ncbi:MAG: hypothetical protein A2157_04455 [Deltaproteobacteria bacterium RBG_16_47_11]|nr:MAG: hypothetical protein A2157_04455 [Deltaproteobacteria bacterium RBG_16_47_11]